MGFEVMLGGVGDAFSLKHLGTHLLIRKNGFLLAVDCPDGFRHGLAKHSFGDDNSRPLDVGDIDALYLTHLHGDHVNGLEMTLAYRTMVLQKEPLRIYGISEVLEELWHRRLQVSLGQMFDGQSFQSIEVERYVEFCPLPMGSVNSIGPFEVELRRTKHHIPTTAMRISDGTATLGYSCDTAFDPELVEWLEKDSALILHESTFGKAHTPLQALQGLDKSVRDRIVVVHYSDSMIDMDHGDLRFGNEGEVFSLGDA